MTKFIQFMDKNCLKTVLKNTTINPFCIKSPIIYFYTFLRSISNSYHW